MEPLGYLHNKMDVKVLVLFILSRIDSPLRLEDLYEVAYQDDSLNYFTLVDLQELCEEFLGLQAEKEFSALLLY